VMGRTWRTVLMWLLVLALPVQAQAAQRMMFCLPAPQQAMVSHEHATGEPPRTMEHHAGHAQDSHDHASHDTSTNPATDTTHSKCSACASCCGAMAMVSAPLIFSASPPAPAYLTTHQPSYSGHTPDRLDRPPRPLLA
jgi:hypothetical protein